MCIKQANISNMIIVPNYQYFNNLTLTSQGIHGVQHNPAYNCCNKCPYVLINDIVNISLG